MLQQKLIIVFVAIVQITKLDALLYPASSTMGLVSSVSVPVVEYFPDRRILFDWCFTMTYQLPSAVSQFYNVPIWPVNKSRRDLNEMLNVVEDKMNVTHLYGKYNRNTSGEKHPSDFTAGELYQGIEDFLVSYGLHETCLLRSVCDLAQHPFDERHENILTDVITFLMTPSMHKGFDQSEQFYRETYENAELHGFLGEDCTKLFPDCKMDIINMITEIIF